MGLSTSTNRVQYTDLEEAEFPIPFPYWQDTEIHAVVTSPDGDEELVQGVDFTITPAPQVESPYGTLTRVTAWDPAGTRVTIYREVDLLQEYHYQNGQKFNAETLEQNLDTIVAMAQQISETNSRAVTTPITDAPVPLELPSAEGRANRYLAFNSIGEAVAVESGHVDPTSEEIAVWAGEGYAATDLTVATTLTEVPHGAFYNLASGGSGNLDISGATDNGREVMVYNARASTASVTIRSGGAISLDQYEWVKLRHIGGEWIIIAEKTHYNKVFVYAGASGNHTVPPGRSKAKITCWGAGGGGGSPATSAQRGASGGASGGKAASFVAVSPGQVIAYSAATGGAGATTSGGTGSTGGDASCGGVVGNGGVGGNGDGSGVSAGGAGTGDYIQYGEGSEYGGSTPSGASSNNGSRGGRAYSAGALGGVNGSAGSNASASGGGGGGSSNSSTRGNGGRGGDAIVVVEYGVEYLY